LKTEAIANCKSQISNCKLKVNEHASIASLARARASILTVGSVSKSLALASAHVGWIAAHRHLLPACPATAALAVHSFPH
jgi:aspartate/methionine/tyrosine aminotransferase